MFIQLFSSCFFFFFVFFFVSCFYFFFFFFSSRRRHTRSLCDWSSDVCSSDLLWAAHLKPELGGQGYGQVKLALLNELLGRSGWAPSVFGCQAPDSGNAEILAHFGTEEQKAKYLQALLDGTISSCYSMTEPHAGADPTLFRTRAVRDGDEWVISGEKWFSSNARYASFFLVMAVTNPDVSAYEGMSMFIVPGGLPGLTIIRNVGTGTEPAEEGSHGYLRYDSVRVPADHLLGGEGGAF